MSPDEIRNVLERHLELWNAKDRDGWLLHWKATAPGGNTLEDPVGTPIKRDMLDEVWDVSFAESDWKITMTHCTVCANEAACLMVNEGEVQGTSVTATGVEIYIFNDDSSVHVRTYYELPEGSAYADWTNSRDANQ
jgi:hypothetical protein